MKTYVAAILLICFSAGCRPRSPEPTRWLNRDLSQLLRYYDNHFDSNVNMLEIEFESPGYHSKVPTGTLTHPTRESLIYALALLQRGDDLDRDRAALIIAKVIGLQDTDLASSTVGVWPWLLEESLTQMSAVDMNWADFCGVQIAQMLVDHAADLSDGLQQSMRGSLRLAADAIRKRDVKPSYTNIAVLGGGVCAIAGELFDDDELLAYARTRLQSVVRHTKQQGGFNEYNSPPYTKVVIAECERVLALVQDRATRVAADSIRYSAWKMAADSFHPGTQQWAGPHSRTSRSRLRKSTTDFLSQRVGVDIQAHPTMLREAPRGYATVSPILCPAELRQSFRSMSHRRPQLKRTFVRSSSPESVRIGTTWFADNACLGSVNRSMFWKQRKPLIAYWRGETDPAVMLRVRFLHDGVDFCSMGIQTVQAGPRTLSLIHPIAGRGDSHPSLDRPANGIFQAQDFRLRVEFDSADKSKKMVASDHRAEFVAGKRKAVVHCPPGKFAGSDVLIEYGDDAMDIVCYQGPTRSFDFNNTLEMALVVAVEILEHDSPASQPPNVVVDENGNVSTTWVPNDGTSLALAR